MSTTRLIGKRTYDSMLLTESPTHPIHHNNANTTTSSLPNTTTALSSSSSCGIEANVNVTPSSSHHYNGHGASLFSSTKRQRQTATDENGTSAISLLSSSNNNASNNNDSNSSRSPARAYEQSQFPAHDIDVNQRIEDIQHHHQQQAQQHQQQAHHKRKHPYHCPCPHSSSSSSTTDDQQLFTSDQVKRILHDALKRQQDLLRAEYDDTLHRLLREQFDSFSAFNRDYISRQLKTSDFSYLS